MKKIVLVLSILVAGVTSTYAANRVESGVINSINDEKVFTRLMNYLKVDADQAEGLKYVIAVTQSKLKKAETKGNQADVEKAMDYNLTNAKSILSDTQYVKYLSMINLTINNRNQDLFLTER
jgi:hypothetical protein